MFPSDLRFKEFKPQILETHNDDFKLNYLLYTKDLTAGLYFIKVSYGSNQKLIKLVIL